jgi:hypothetical protein
MVQKAYNDSDYPAFDLETLQARVQENHYSVRSHAVDHMFKEGFSEHHIINAILTGRILEAYPEENRCLILGYLRLQSNKDTTIPLHIVCDYCDPTWVDIVTAYVPQRPWWVTPTQRGRGVK